MKYEMKFAKLKIVSEAHRKRHRFFSFLASSYYFLEDRYLFLGAVSDRYVTVVKYSNYSFFMAFILIIICIFSLKNATLCHKLNCYSKFPNYSFNYPKYSDSFQLSLYEIP